MLFLLAVCLARQPCFVCRAPLITRIVSSGVFNAHALRAHADRFEQTHGLRIEENFVKYKRLGRGRALDKVCTACFARICDRPTPRCLAERELRGRQAARHRSLCMHELRLFLQHSVFFNNVAAIVYDSNIDTLIDAVA